jgi:hypothetical protein
MHVLIAAIRPTADPSSAGALFSLTRRITPTEATVFLKKNPPLRGEKLLQLSGHRAVINKITFVFKRK